jgi:long-chain acyl-CoA synthetase
MTELASYKHAFIIVALYDTLGAEAMEYIVNQTDMEYIVLSADKLDNIVKLKAQLPTIKTIVVMDDVVDAAKKEAAQQVGISVHTFKEVEQLGASYDGDLRAPQPEDIATICYTR